MSINIRTNMSNTMRSLGEQGAFRNSMYQNDEEKQNRKSKKNTMKVVKQDLPDNFINNDKVRMKSAGLHSEISHVEEEISIAQTAEQALAQTEKSLKQMKELVDLVGTETEFNRNLRKADQDELEQLINRINKIADETSYGQNHLLDGSKGIRGVANGKYLEFVGMSSNSKASPLSGYEVEVTKVATRAELKGKIPLTQEIINNVEIIVFEEGGISNRFITKKEESVSSTFKSLAEWISKRELPIEIVENSKNILHFRHLQYGSTYSFGVSSSTKDLISSESQKVTFAKSGFDVSGSINGIQCSGHGQFLSCPEEAEGIGKLTIRYSGNEIPSDSIAGIVSVSQNGFQFLTGNTMQSVEKLCLKSIHASDLGMETDNVSGFKSLQDINILTGQSVKDSLCVIVKSLSEVTDVKANVSFVCGETLKSNMLNLKQEHDRLVDSDPNLENSLYAKAFAELTKNKITENSGESSIAQAHQNPKSVLTLLK